MDDIQEFRWSRPAAGGGGMGLAGEVSAGEGRTWLYASLASLGTPDASIPLGGLATSLGGTGSTTTNVSLFGSAEPRCMGRVRTMRGPLRRRLPQSC